MINPTKTKARPRAQSKGKPTALTLTVPPAEVSTVAPGQAITTSAGTAIVTRLEPCGEIVHADYGSGIEQPHLAGEFEEVPSIEEVTNTYAAVLEAIAKMEGQEYRPNPPLAPQETTGKLPTKPVFVSVVAIWEGVPYYANAKEGRWRKAKPAEYTALCVGDEVSEQGVHWAYEFVKISGSDAICRFPSFHNFLLRIQLEELQVRDGFSIALEPPLEPSTTPEGSRGEVLGVDTSVSNFEPLPEFDPAIERVCEVLGVAVELQTGDRIHGMSLLGAEYSGVFEGYAESGLVILRHATGKRGTKLVKPDVVKMGDRFSTAGKVGTVTALENNRITLQWCNGQISEYKALELEQYGFARQVLGVGTSEVMEQITPRTLEQIEQDADDSIATIEQQIRLIQAAGSIAPDGCWIEYGKCSGKRVRQAYYRANQPIFAGKKRQYIGMEGDQKTKAAAAAVSRRNEIGKLRKQLKVLEGE